MRTDLAVTGRTRRCLNLGSYNYLGFAAADEYCTPRVLDTLAEWGMSTCSARTEGGACRQERGEAAAWTDQTAASEVLSCRVSVSGANKQTVACWPFAAGTTPQHKEMETLVASFLGKEDAIVFGMGFATNAASIPALAGALLPAGSCGSPGVRLCPGLSCFHLPLLAVVHALWLLPGLLSLSFVSQTHS